ncbi:MAG: hypothetical protein AAF213_05710 [Pseudomonadota bacterium]
MNMMSFLRHRSFGLAPNYRTNLASAKDYLRADILETEASISTTAWHPGQNLVSLRTPLPEEEAPITPPLNLLPDTAAIAHDDAFVALRPAEQQADDPADLLLRLLASLRAQRSNKRIAGRASALFLAWKLRKLDRDQAIEPDVDARAVNEILSRLKTLSK